MLLKEVSKRLKTIMREDDLVARLGGDEFAVILSELTSKKEAVLVAEKIQNMMKKPFMLQGKNYEITASIGIVSFEEGNYLSAISLVKNADIAMYAAKDRGRNKIQVFDNQLQSLYEKMTTLEEELKEAVNNRDFFLVYQPIFKIENREIKTAKIIGVEALLRWKKKNGEIISPAVFIPLLEKTNLIVSLGEWILDAACKQLKSWIVKKVVDQSFFKVAINISYIQLQNENFFSKVMSILKSNEISPKNIVLELTETVLMEDPNRTSEVIKRFHTQGVDFSIDDFGTGYSSLGYLKELPIRNLKIDRAFIRDVATNPSDAIIVKTIINLADNLYLNVIAEGVELKEQLDFLVKEACTSMQGFYLQVPVEGVEVAQLLSANTKGFDFNRE